MLWRGRFGAVCYNVYYALLSRVCYFILFCLDSIVIGVLIGVGECVEFVVCNVSLVVVRHNLH